MKAAKCLIIFLLIAKYGSSQTIINAERLTDGTDSTIYSFVLSYNGTKGNSNTDQFDISPNVVLLREKNDYKLFGGYSLLSESSNRILNTGFVHIRHNFKLTGRIKTFEFYQIQFNKVLLLTKREVFGAGLRFSLLNNDNLKFDFGTGVMREVEVLNKTFLLPDELSETKYYRITCVNTISWIAGKIVKIHNVLYYQPYLNDFNDYRLLDEFNFIVSITEHFELLTSLTTRYDSKPPGKLNKLDNVISFGFNVKF